MSAWRMPKITTPKPRYFSKLLKESKNPSSEVRRLGSWPIQVFPPFQFLRSVPSCSAMLIELLKQLIIELVRALFLEELCQRVKATLVKRSFERRIGRQKALLRHLHVRHRERLLHRLT